MADEPRWHGSQDTGNPVLDSLVNLAGSMQIVPMAAPQNLAALHAVLLQLAEKEPGGLKRRTTQGTLELARSNRRAEPAERPPLRSLSGEE